MARLRSSLGVLDNVAARRFEVAVGDEVAYLNYRLDGDTIHLIHTEVPKTLGGRGIGSELARAALESARARGLKVVPSCPFVRTYLERHPEFAS